MPTPNFLGPYIRHVNERPSFDGRMDHFGNRRRLYPKQPAKSYQHNALTLKQCDAVVIGGLLFEVIQQTPELDGMRSAWIRPIGDLEGGFDGDDPRLDIEAELVITEPLEVMRSRPTTLKHAAELLGSMGLRPYDINV